MEKTNREFCTVCGKRTHAIIKVKGEKIPLCFGKCRKEYEQQEY